jgi:hypothetical protein
LKNEDYPAMYGVCDECAGKSQKSHFRLLQARIVLLIAIAVLGAVVWKTLPDLGIYPPLALTITLAILLIFTVIMENKKFEKNWVVTRGAAEMIKRETWLFMMKAKPYDQGDSEARTTFRAFLRQLSEVKSLPLSARVLLAPHHGGSQITSTMEKQRTEEFSNRRENYVKNRITDQIDWYSRKAIVDSAKESRMSLFMWILLALAVVFALINVVAPNLPINLVGIATTSSASMMSWIGARGYRELSQAYSSAAHQLGFIECDTSEASNEAQLSSAVEDAERVMSQEHNLWRIEREIA